MGRFDDRATRPGRGPRDFLRWQAERLKNGGGARTPRGYETPRRENDGSRLAELQPHLTWVGHASFTLRLGGKLIAFDPIWREGFGPRRRLSRPGLPLRAVAEHVDIVVVSHDHLDHLDLETLKQLGDKPLYVVPLGVGRVLQAISRELRVVELDWWQTHAEGELQISLAPARHWSMRKPWGRNSTLWGGFVVRGPEGAAYHSGDTGFFDTFEEIGQRLGPIDWAMLPIGAYAPRWFMEPQHMCPEEAGFAFELLQAHHLVAMHWGTFRLTDEPTNEPPERLRRWASERGYDDERIWILDVGEMRRL